jgi:predicted nucleotidyltransferase
MLESAAAHGIRNVRVFGSVARGEARLDSDLDLLVDIEIGTGILGPGAFYMDVWDLLEVRPDIVEAAALRGRMRREVLDEAVPL